MRHLNLFLVLLVISVMAGSALPDLPAPSLLHEWWVCEGALIIGGVFVVRRHACTSRYRHAVILVVLIVTVIFFGVLWSLHYGEIVWEHRLPESWANKDFQVEGVVVNLPEQTERGERFDLAVTRILFPSVAGDTPLKLKKLRLNAYTLTANASGLSGARYQPGQQWRVWVRLKPPHAMLNPYGFDYEGWLLQSGYSAVGYVRESRDNQELSARDRNALLLDIAVQFDRWGWASLQWIDAHIDNRDRRSLFAAMALGYQDEFTRHDWDLLKNTGTIHLVVVSGLNIVLAASVGFFLLGVISRLLVFPLHLLPAPVWSAAGAIVTAIIYAGMTGFSLPTQRSLIMVLCGLATLLFKKQLPISTGYWLAFALVMLLDPLAATTASLWLSFGAVGILLYSFSSRIDRSTQVKGWRILLTRPFYVRCITTQVAVSFGLFPLIEMWMGYYPLVTPLANLVAVPFATFVLMPLSILTGLACKVSAPLGQIVLSFCERCLDLFWWFLEQMQAMNTNVYLAMGEVPTAIVITLSMLAVLLWCAPRGIFPCRWHAPFFGTILLLPLLLPWRDTLPAGEFRLTMVDVGQGLGLVIETAHSVNVYDTGSHFSDQLDMGRDVIAPLIRRRGYRHLATVLISHADSDHAGGLKGLLSQLETNRLFSGNATIIRERLASDEHFRTPASLVQSCARGQTWENDGIHFKILAPEPAQDSLKRNNNSCVLRVSNAHFSVLFTGDIERDEEAVLLQHPEELKSDVLIVPHHGSRSSSSPDFLKAVDPAWALVSVGYHSQYGHPHPEVVERYQQLHIPLVRTDLSGAITLSSRAANQEPSATRDKVPGYWHRW